MTAMESDFGPVEYTPESSPYDDREALEREINALERVSSLPLVAGTWGLMSAYYVSAKKTYPSVSPYFELAERITSSAAGVALTTAKPVVDKFAPTVNVYANRGLDKLESALPIIHDEPDEAYGSAKAAVTSAVNRKIDSALSLTEKYVEYYLPPSEDAAEADDSEADSDDDDDCDTSSTVSSEMEDRVSPKERLQVISGKVRRRAYHRAMDKIHAVQKRSIETLGQLKFTVDLIQYAKENIDSTSEGIASKISSANDAIRNGVASSQENVAAVWKEAAELHLLERMRSLTATIQKSCSSLVRIVTKIPQNEFLAKKIALAKEAIENFACDLTGKTSLKELPFSVIETAQANIDRAKNIIEAMFELIVEYTPTSWLAPDFDCDLLEGLFVQDVEAELRLNHDNGDEILANEAVHSRHVSFGRV